MNTRPLDIGNEPANKSTGAAPTVSVVLPCYNSHLHVQQTLDSLRAQSFCDFEIILVNDGSDNPETVAFIDQLETDVHVIYQRNMGLSAARNMGIRAARGTYIVPLDCDDWLDPEFLGKAVAKIQQTPEKSFVFSYLNLCGDLSGVLAKDFNSFEQLFLNQLPYCLMYPREAWRAIGGYDETMRRGYEDWEFNIRLSRHGYRGVVIREPLFHYRVSDTGMLKSVSQKLHGVLWQSIQKKNHRSYRWGAMYRGWREWRHQPSTYPLVLFFGWYIAHRLLPKPLFGAVFRWLLPYRHSARIVGR